MAGVKLRLSLCSVELKVEPPRWLQRLLARGKIPRAPVRVEALPVGDSPLRLAPPRERTGIVNRGFRREHASRVLC